MHRKIDLPLLLITSGLIIFGLLMVYSASNVVALYKYDDSYYFIKRQFIFAAIGIVVMFIMTKIDIYKISKYTSVIFIISLVFLILVLIPGIGMVRGGARSWIGIGSLSFQPSEFIKFTIILLFAKYFSKYDKDLLKFKNFLLLLFIFGGLWITKNILLIN